MTDNNFLWFTVKQNEDVKNFSDDTSFNTQAIDDDDKLEYGLLPGKYKNIEYVKFGADDRLPYVLRELIGKDSVLAPNQYNNVVTCYGNGVHFMDRETDKPTKNSDINEFVLRNAIPRFFLEQITDMKYYFFSVSVIILDKDGSKIVQLRHRDACNCRFEKQNSKGVIEHVIVANFSGYTPLNENDIEIIPVLNEVDPIGDLEQRLGKAPGADGEMKARTNDRKFAIVTRFPTVGNPYYPTPYYSSIFKDQWYEIKHLIGFNKKQRLKNPLTIKYLVSIHPEYWANIIKQEGITDPEKQKERINEEKNKIKNFIENPKSQSQIWISGRIPYPTNGNSEDLVRIDVIKSDKEGGEWSDDIQESTNIMCYSTSIHPNLFGAVPGKAQTNNSGSDKRELFTMKQAMEKAPHDLLSMPFNLVLYYNGWWNDTYVDVPFIQLTTLDEKKDAKTVSNSNSDDNEDNSK